MPITPEQEQEFIKQNQIYSAPQNAFLAQVSQMPQDQAVKILRLSMQAGLDPVEAARNPTAAIQNLIGATDFEDVGKFAPKTYSFLNDPLHMAIARDKRNVMTLADLENENKVWTSFKNGVKDLGRNTVGFLQGIADNLAKGSENNRDNMPPEYKMWSEQGGTKVLQNTATTLAQAANSDVLKPKEVKADTTVGQYGLDFVRTAPQIAAQIAAAILTGGTGSMLFMGTQIAGSEYQKLRGEGIEPERAFQASVMDAAAQAPLERIGLNKIMKKLPANSSRKLKAREIIESSLTEGVTEWLQQYPEAAIEIWARHPEYTPEQRGAQFMRDFAEITKEGAYQGLVAAPFGFLVGAVKVSMQKKTVEANLAQHEKIQAIVANTPVLRDNPEFAEKYLEELTDGAKTYIDADALLTLYQSDILPKEEISELLGVTEDQVEEAAASGQMVEVSRAKYDVASVQHKEIHQALKDDIAQGEDGVTMRQVVERKESAKNLQDIKQAQEEVKKQRDEVKAESDKIFEQMKAAGVRDDVAKSALVALVKNAYVMSDNPAQWLRDKGPIFQRGAASPEGSLHQFAGPSAKTADHLGLSQAKQMEKDGADNEAIRKATGWHKGMEGKWRFEIDDSQAALIDQGQLQATSKEIETLYKQANKAKDPAVKEELLAKADEMAANYDEATKPRLRNILNHPALYKEYPWIGDVKVIQSKLPDGENGGYDPATNTIQLSKDLSPDKMRETLLHEVQHVIQEQEDFARGGSPEGVSEEAFNQYQRLAGEVEARDTANRAGLTDEQRKETAPDLRSDAIVVHGGKDIAYNPEKGYNIGNKDGSEYEVEGSPYAAILRETGEYEGSVIVRDAEGNAYGPDARSSAVRTPGNRSGKTIGLAVTPELVEHGVISLVGRTVRSPKELATISHVLRHPGYEKFHIVYVSGDKVVHHETISAGLPDRASIMEVGQTHGQFFQRVHNNLSSFAADGYYLIHNHPSGDPRPSGADVSLTKYIANITTAGGNANNPINRSFKGHIVLDHTTYSYIGKDGGHYQSDIDTSQVPADSYDATSMPHWSLDTAITSPTAVAGLAAGMNLDPNNSVVFYLTTKHKVRGVQIVPNALLADEKKAVRYLRMQARKHYSARFIIVTDNDQTYNTSRELVKNYEHVLDVYHVSAQRYGMKEVSKNANSDEWMGILDKGGGTRLLEDIGSLYQNNDDKLYAAYPDLANVKVEPGNLDGDKGSYDPTKNAIELEQALSPEEAREVLLREIQHAVQEQENFARDGSADLTEEQRKEIAPDIRSDAIIVWGGREYEYSNVEGQITPEENIQRGQDAIKTVLETKSDVQKSMYRPETGWIEFVWGQEGTADKDYENGFGIAKILSKHGMDDLKSIPEVIAKGKTELSKTKDRVYFTLDDKLAVVRLTWDGKERVWLLTGFTKGQYKKPPVSPEDVGPSGTTLSERSFTEGAEASLDNSIPKPGELFQSQNITDTPAFRAWFGDSKAVDEHGKPLVLYHGTNAEFDTFDSAYQNQTHAQYGQGFYFAESPEMAKLYGDRVIPVYLSATYGLPEKRADRKAGRPLKEIDYIHVKEKGIWVVKKPEQIKSINNRGTFDLNNPNIFMQIQGSPKGSIHWNEEGRAIITLFQNADPSTVIHEMVGHYFVQNLIDQGARDDAPAWMKKDRKAALAYAGIEDWETATKEQRIQAHEKLARAAEAYMMEGKAPSIETRSMFKRFKEWLTRIYDTVSGLGVELNPEIRGVFDRMLATEEEIRQVELLENYHQRLPKEILDTLSEGQKTQLDKAISAAREKAENILREKVMRFISADNQFEMDEERKKAMEFIREEVAREPLYIARAAMSAPANMKEVQAAIDARIEELINEQVEILVHNAKLGVEKKGAVIDDEGYMTGEWYGGFSNNQKWYKDMLELLPGRRLPKAWGEYIDWVRAGKLVEEGKRPRRMPPKMREMFRDIAISHLERGWYEETFGEIPENQEFLALRQSSPSWEIIYNYGGGLKLNEEQTRAMYPDKVDQLPQNMLTKNGGFTADLLADIFGFSSGDELLYRITTNPTFGQEVQRRLKLHMQQFKDLIADPEAMRQEAEEAMYNDDGLTLLAIEDQLIKEKLGQILNAEQMRQAAAFRREEAKRSAEKAMANLPIEKAIKLHTYIAAERRAAEKVAKALAKGDMETAQEQKAVQMFNHAMVMKSLEIRRQFEKTTKYLKRQQKSDKATWKKEEHFAQAAEILRRFGFLRKDYEPAMRKETLAEWAKRLDETMQSVAIADWILLEKFESDPKKLTIEQLRDVENAVRNIKRLAQTENTFVKLFKQADIAEVVATSAEKLADAKDIYVKEPEEDVSPQNSRKKSYREYSYSSEKITTFLNRLDKWHDFGWFHNLIYRPAYDAANQVSKLLHMIRDKEEASLRELCPTKEAREALDKRVYYPELGASVSKRYLLEMASHTGSESNRRVLFGKAPVGLEKSSLWVRNADGKVDAETMAMTQDRVMNFLAQNLTAAEWEWVQRGWDNINLLWPLAQEVHQRMTGFFMQKVEALPFETKTADGQTVVLQGGYYPLKEDYRSNSRAAKREEEREGQPLYTESFAMSVPKTFTGYTHERTGATYSIDLRQTNRYRHIQAVAHDIAFREVITDLRRLVNNTEFKELLETKTGPEGYRMIREFVAVAANPKTEAATIGQNTMDKWANWLRERTIIAALMLNMKTALQNLSNPFLYGNAVDGFSHVDALNGFLNRGAFRFWTQERSYREDCDFVLSKSAFMRDRVDSPDYTLNEFKNDENFWMKWGGKLLAETDNLTAVPMWLEAYHKKLGEGASEADAIFYADTLIDRAIGSGRKIDTASIMRGNATTRLITMFGTFMNTQFNSWKREFGIALRDRDAIRLFTTAAARWLLFSISGLLLAFDLPDQDDDKWVNRWASEILAYPVRLFPVVGNLAAVAINRSIGGSSFGVRLSPVESMGETAIQALLAPVGYIQGKKTGADVAESIMSAAAFLRPYPDQFNHWFWNAYDILFNDMEPESGDLLKRRPRKER